MRHDAILRAAIWWPAVFYGSSTMAAKRCDAMDSKKENQFFLKKSSKKFASSEKVRNFAPA